MLRHRATNFSVRADRGYRLQVYRGIYTIRRGRESVTRMRLRSPVDQRSTAQGLASTARLRGTRVVRRGRTHRVTGQVGTNLVLVDIVGQGPVFTVTKYSLPRNRVGNQRARRVRALTPRDVAALRRIVGTARGGIVSPLPPAMPMRRFAQGGASALVPALPGWTHNGFNGALAGGRPGQALYGFGTPGFIPFYIASGNAVFTEFPKNFGGGVVVTDVAFIPGSAGVLGPGFDSAIYSFRFLAGGIPHEGIILSGTNDNLFYHSYISVREGLPPGIGQALVGSWNSWDPSPAVTARLAQTLNTLRTTAVPGNPIDQRVFDRLHEAWREYIRR